MQAPPLHIIIILEKYVRPGANNDEIKAIIIELFLSFFSSFNFNWGIFLNKLYKSPHIVVAIKNLQEYQQQNEEYEKAKAEKEEEERQKAANEEEQQNNDGGEAEEDEEFEATVDETEGCKSCKEDVDIEVNVEDSDDDDEVEDVEESALYRALYAYLG